MANQAEIGQACSMPTVSLRSVQRCVFVFAALALFSGTPRETVAAQGVKGKASFATSRDGIRIAYEKAGAGPTALVFVHGWSCDRSYFAGQMEPFSKDFTVVAIDLAGHGESGLGRKAFTMASFGGDVAAVVDKLGLKRIILIGHSMGGDVVPEAALRLPGLVIGLIWLDAYKQLGKGRSREQVSAFIAKLRPHFADSTRALVRGMFLPSSDRALVELKS